MTGGIFDGFEDYRTPTEDDYRRTLTGGLVVFDANVLLNLYRFNSTTRGDLIKVMQGLGDSLWIPHQVMREFWRNRESVIDQLGETPKESLTKLAKAQKESEEAVRAWSNRIYLPDSERDDHLNRLNGAFNAIRATISEQVAADAHSHDTNNDAIVHALNSILVNRKGSALSPEDHAAAVTEAERRITAQEPPGYLDKDKADPDERAGDYLVWKQILVEAERRSVDVLLVTSDTKPDWWRHAKGQRRGPRLELMAEFRGNTGRRLFMLTPSELIRRAGALTDVHVDPKSAENIERVEESRAEPVPREVEDAVMAEVYRRAGIRAWSATGVSSHRTLSELVDDPAIGGVLADHMTAQEARIWIKEVVTRWNLPALYGLGPHAKLVPQRYQTADEIIEATCGSDWYAQSQAEESPEYNCLATNGTNTRRVWWALNSGFEDLLTAATRSHDAALGRPMIVILHDAVRPDHEYYTSVANQAGVDIAYLKRKLSPNPDYVG